MHMRGLLARVAPMLDADLAHLPLAEEQDQDGVAVLAACDRDALLAKLALPNRSAAIASSKSCLAQQGRIESAR